MDNKLQQKFALVQQMKKEKELKEASRVKDHRSVDIFALAGVNLPKPKSSLSTAVPTLTQSRQDSANKSNNSRHEPPVKRPRVQKVSGAGAGAGAGTGIETGIGVGAGAGMEKKLKRSSMAVRNAAASHLHGSNVGECSDKLGNSSYSGRGRNPSINSVASPPYTSTPGHHHASDSNHSATATPPTPIPSPRNDPTVQTDSPNGGRPGTNGRRWSGSTDSREGIVQTAHGQSLRAVRHQSPDTITNYQTNAMHPLADQAGSQEHRKRRIDSHRDFGRHPGDYENHRPRFRSTSCSRSPSPSRQSSFRSRSRSVSPYRDQGPDFFKRRDSARDFEQDCYPHHDTHTSAIRHQEPPPLLSKIRIEGLADSTSVTALLAAFGPYGEIEEANLVEGKNIAFVTYTRLDAAQRALEMMSGSMVDGAHVRVFREEFPMYYQRGSGSEAGTISPLPTRDGARRPSLATSTSSASSQGLMTPETTTSRPIHQLPPRPRSPKLPPKPVTAVYPPVGADPRAAVAQARGRGRQILSYGDL
ncbi:hypothetical protein K457DRAFT_132519 [Linnemannia elongata AG-77]|uniref:RRM domain-containing protein n=1 Tax=Linnemannia elongata AG-77 TaxID=1314771 RepID=A0A197KGT0_9FUNG|nr:hypothetical protein K457DRAFT_132519 [Linnemannia elongata AG-77]